MHTVPLAFQASIRQHKIQLISIGIFSTISISSILTDSSDSLILNSLIHSLPLRLLLGLTSNSWSANFRVGVYVIPSHPFSSQRPNPSSLDTPSADCQSQFKPWTWPVWPIDMIDGAIGRFWHCGLFLYASWGFFDAQGLFMPRPAPCSIPSTMQKKIIALKQFYHRISRFVSSQCWSWLDHWINEKRRATGVGNVSTTERGIWMSFKD